MKKTITKVIFISSLALFGWSFSNAQTISTIAGTGIPGFSGDGAAATSAQMQYPFGGTVDASGNVYFTDGDNDVVRKITVSTGIITTIAGNGTRGYSGDGAAATSAMMDSPNGVSIDNSGNVFIADMGNSRIRKVTISTGIITTVAGNGTPGYSGDGALATSAMLKYPYGVYVDNSGNIYIPDTHNHRVRVVSASTGLISTIGGDGNSGYSGDGALATSANLFYPEGVYVDAPGNVYIADNANNAVRKITASSGIISTIAGTGIAGYSGDGSIGTSAKLNLPTSVYADASFNVYIADRDNFRIRKVTASGIISTIAGNGTQGFSGDGGAATSAQLRYPTGVALDAAGNLYIVDQQDHRVRKVTAPTTPTTTTTKQSIAAGNGFSLSLCSDSTVKAWGNNYNGDLGDGTTTNSLIQVQVSGLTGIVSVVSESNHSLALKDDGTVWAWGFNQYGQLGDSTTDISGCYCKPTPVQVHGLTGVIAIACGSHHSLALKSDGTVWAWGRNSYSGQLGDGTSIDKYTPVQVSGLTGIVAITAGDFHSLAIKNDGTLWSWGSNSSGQIGDGSSGDKNAPVQVSSLTNVIGIAAGQGHSMALKSDSTVWTWGYNYNGQLGNGTGGSFAANPLPAQVSGLSGVTYIASGFNHSLAVKNNGTLWAWGANYSGQLGDGTTTESDVPLLISGFTGATQLAGKNHTLALKSDGTIWAWGSNSYGELGDGTYVTSSVPVQRGDLCSFTTGVNEITEQPSFSVFPNPTNGKFTIEFPNKLQAMNVEIYNLLGEKILQLKNTNIVDLSNSPKGIYFVKVYGEINSYTKKIIIE